MWLLWHLDNYTHMVSYINKESGSTHTKSWCCLMCYWDIMLTVKDINEYTFV